MAIPTHFALLAVAPGLAALRLLLLAVAAALTAPRRVGRSLQVAETWEAGMLG
jgi:hypothetical protein